jgi:hypothetical protein
MSVESAVQREDEKPEWGNRGAPCLADYHALAQPIKI